MTHTTTPDTTALETAYETTSAALTALLNEQGSISQQRTAAIATGDGDRAVTLETRLRELPTRVVMARLAYVKAGFALAQAECHALEAHYAEHPPRILSAVDTGGLMRNPMPQDLAEARMRLQGFHDAHERVLREVQQ